MKKYVSKFDNAKQNIRSRLTEFVSKTQPILPVRVVEKKTACCLLVVYGLMID